MKRFLSIIFALIISGNLYATEPLAQYKEALTLIEQGKRMEARRLLKELTVKYTDWGLFYLEYAANCIYIECPEDEISENLIKAEGLLIDNPRFYFYKGLFLEGKKPDEALKLYDKAIALRPAYTDALIRACSIYADKGDFKSAISYYESIPVEMRSSTLILKIINLLSENKEYMRAEKEILGLVNNHPENELYLTKLREFYQKTGQKEKERKIADRIKRLFPNSKKYMRPLK
ncbi:MAG: tetratricopeptide repeat protein [Myxococcota bacterium]